MKIELKIDENLVINKEMVLDKSILGEQNRLQVPKKDNFKLFIKYVKKTYAGYHIATNNGILTIEYPARYLREELHFNTRTYDDGTIVESLLITALPRIIYYEGRLLDIVRLINIIDLIEKNDDIKDSILTTFCQGDYIDDFVNQIKKILREIENNIAKRESIIEFELYNTKK